MSCLISVWRSGHLIHADDWIHAWVAIVAQDDHSGCEIPGVIAHLAIAKRLLPVSVKFLNQDVGWSYLNHGRGRLLSHITLVAVSGDWYLAWETAFIVHIIDGCQSYVISGAVFKAIQCIADSISNIERWSISTRWLPKVDIITLQIRFGVRLPRDVYACGKRRRNWNKEKHHGYR